MSSVDDSKKCARIIECPSMKEHMKVKRLRTILKKDSSCLQHPILLSGGEIVRGTLGSLLHAAVCDGYKDIAELLLNYGIDPNMLNNFNYPPIFAACNMSLQDTIDKSAALTKLLLDHGADVNISDFHGQTPLFLAVQYRHSTEVVELLISRGATVTPQCLSHSLQFRTPENAKVLIKHLLLQDLNMEKPPALNRLKRLSSFWDECKLQIETELDVMKWQKLGNSTISVHDIFVANESKLADYVQNDAVKDLLNDDYKNLYPMYIDRLKLQYQKGIERRAFENQASIVMDHWLPTIFNLSARQKVFEYLNMQDLKNIKEAGILTLDGDKNTLNYEMTC